MEIYVIVALVSYLLGSIPFGYILVRLFLKTDVRSVGSGNIGATNVGRTGHKGLAIATLLLDAGKGALAVAHAQHAAHAHVAALPAFSRDNLIPVSAWPVVLGAIAALCVVLGHCFPVWLKFKGGKGVAASVGAFALLAPPAVLISVGVFLATVAVTRYVSLGSILAAVAFPIAVYFLDGHRYGDALALIMASIILTSALVIGKHHANIRRLLAGTENKLGAKAALPQNPIQAEKNA